MKILIDAMISALNAFAADRNSFKFYFSKRVKMLHINIVGGGVCTPVRGTREKLATAGSLI